MTRHVMGTRGKKWRFETSVRNLETFIFESPLLPPINNIFVMSSREPARDLLLKTATNRDEILQEAIKEAKELTAIFTASGRTAKGNNPKTYRRIVS
jgi:hypothetical protein